MSYSRDDYDPEGVMTEEERFKLYGGCVRCFATKPFADSPDLCAACERECDKPINKESKCVTY
jgi:hypothetical protein